jgi:hypothetical protein
MATTKVGTISVELIAKTTSFSDAMTKASQISLNTSRNVQRSLGLISVAATAMAGGVTAALTAVITKSEEFVFTMQQMAEKTGTTVENFSRLAYAARSAGVPVDLLKTSMERLARTSYAAQSGQKGSAEAFAALGISVNDLKGPLNDSSALMIEVAKRLDKYKDSTNKTGLEQKLFSRSGAELAPILRLTGNNFEELSRQAEKYGVVISGEAAEKSRQLHQNIVQLQSAIQGMGVKILTSASPALSELAQKFLAFATSAKGQDAIARFGDVVAKGVTLAGKAFDFLVQHATAVKLILEAIAISKVTGFMLSVATNNGKAGASFANLATGAGRFLANMTGFGDIERSVKSLTPVVSGLASSFGGVLTTGMRNFAASSAAGKASVAEFLASIPTLAASAVAAIKGISFNGISFTALTQSLQGMVSSGLIAAKTGLQTLKFAILDSAVAADVFVKANGGIKNVMMDLVSVGQVLVNQGLDKIRVAFVAIQNLNVTGLFTGFGAAISQFATTAVASIGGVTAALWDLTVAAVVNPLTWLVVGAAALAAATVAMYRFRDSAITVNGEGFLLRDTWQGAWIGIKSGLDSLWERFKGFCSTVKSLWGDVIGWFSKTAFGSIILEQISKAVEGVKSLIRSLASYLHVPAWLLKGMEESKRQREQSEKQKSAPASTGAGSTDKPVAPPLPGPPAKVDELMKRLKELQDSAIEAKKALNDVGNGPDYLRADKIDKDVIKFLDQYADKIKLLSKAQQDKLRADVRAAVTLQVNSDAERELDQQIIDGTRSIEEQTNATLLRNDAIRAGTKAMHDAVVQSQLNTFLSGKSDEWKRGHPQEIEKYRSAIDKSTSVNEDAKITQDIASLQDEVNTQDMLNKAILRGSDARQQASLQIQIQQMRLEKFNGDQSTNNDGINKQIDLLTRLDELKQRSAALDKAASMNPQIAYLEAIKRTSEAAQAARGEGQPLDDRAVMAANKEALDQYYDSVNKTNLAVGNGLDGIRTYFQEMARGAESAAQQIHDVLGGAFESLNDTVLKVMNGQKASWSSFFHGIGDSLVKISLQKTEQGIANVILGAAGQGQKGPGGSPIKGGVGGILGGILGGGKAPVGTSGDPLHVKVVGMAGSGMPSLGGLSLPKVTSSGDDNGGGGWFSKFLGFGSHMASSFAGHLAGGGDVKAGYMYDVGEMGRERFVPTQNGRIVPNNKLGGDSHTYHIDASGSSNPAATEAAVHRAMQKALPHSVAASVQTQHQQKLRSPAGARRG